MNGRLQWTDGHQNSPASLKYELTYPDMALEGNREGPLFFSNL